MPIARIGAGEADEDRISCIVNRKGLRAGELLRADGSDECVAAQRHPKAHVPYPRSSVHGRRDDTAAIGTKDGGLEAASMAVDLAKNFTAGASRMRAVRSDEAVTMRVPSALNAALETRAAWPLSSRNMSPVSAFQTRTSPDVSAVTRRFPSGLSAVLLAHACDVPRQRSGRGVPDPGVVAGAVGDAPTVGADRGRAIAAVVILQLANQRPAYARPKSPRAC
jgi:hypothetical protein